MQCQPCEPGEEQQQQQQRQSESACGDCDAGARRTCARCRVRIFQSGVGGGVANMGADADREREPEATGQVPELERRFSNLMSNGMYSAFDQHAQAVQTALEKRRERLQFASNTMEELVEDTMADTEDVDAGLGVWKEEDVWQGDVNLRTLNALLERVDQRGFERHAPSNQTRHTCALWSQPFPFPTAGAPTNWNSTRPFSKRARGSSSKTTGRFPSRKSAASTTGKRSSLR